MSESHAPLAVPNQSDFSALATALEDCQVLIVEDSPDHSVFTLHSSSEPGG